MMMLKYMKDNIDEQHRGWEICGWNSTREGVEGGGGSVGLSFIGGQAIKLDYYGCDRHTPSGSLFAKRAIAIDAMAFVTEVIWTLLSTTIMDVLLIRITRGSL